MNALQKRTVTRRRVKRSVLCALFHFPCLEDNEQDWPPYPVDAQPAERDDRTHTFVTTNNHNRVDPYLYRNTGMTGPGCVVMCNLINTHTAAAATTTTTQR